MATFKFNVYLDKKWISAVFYYDKNESIQKMIASVKNGLVNRDGYDPAIRVTWPKGQRSTETVYELHGDYGSGFELLCAETSRREALQRKREYMENAPCPLKIVKKLERK